MHGSIDVLAVMDDVSRNHDNGSFSFDDLREARSAVAELIEADTEYDAARAAWLADNADHEAFLATRAAWDSRAAALVRVRGSA